MDGDNDGNSVVDMGAYEFFPPPMEVPMKLAPQALNPCSKGEWVKAHCVLPEGFAMGDVDTNNSAKITEPSELDIESEYMNVLVGEEGLIEIEIGFDLDCNSIVNFVDFALFDGCCIGVTAE